MYHQKRRSSPGRGALGSSSEHPGLQRPFVGDRHVHDAPAHAPDVGKIAVDTASRYRLLQERSAEPRRTLLIGKLAALGWKLEPAQSGTVFAQERILVKGTHAAAAARKLDARRQCKPYLQPG